MGDKRILFVRHAHSLYNAIAHDGPVGGHFEPELYDSGLSELGISQVAALRTHLAALAADVDLLIISPLSRCLMTAVAFDPTIPVVVQPLCSEWVTDSCDLGRTSEDLCTSFPMFAGAIRAAELPPLWWFPHPEVPVSLQAAAATCLPSLNPAELPPLYAAAVEWMAKGGIETEEELAARALRFAAWLRGRPETRVAVCTHSDFANELTGHFLKNTETLETNLSELLCWDRRSACGKDGDTPTTVQ